MRIQQTTLDELQTCDLSIIASQYTVLKSGKKSEIGLCPLHNEKTPSFHVYKDDNRYKCFGCGKSGDAIQLIREVEKIDFTDAVKKACETYNVAFKTFESDEDKKIKKYSKVLEKFYNQSTPYPDSDIEIFKELGIITENKKWFFGNRKLYKIHDEYGFLRGFSGRTLDDNIKPKYKNSSDSWLFKKSELLFNLHNAKKHKGQNKACVLVEGFTDVEALESKGVLNSIASCGTALTKEQAELIAKYFDVVTVMYDNDKNRAGQKAAFKALDILLKAGLEVNVIWLPPFLDPKDFITNGHELKDLKPKNFLLEKCRMIKKVEDFKIQLLKIPSLFESLNCIESNLKREMYVNECAKILTLDSFKSDFKTYKLEVSEKNAQREKYAKTEQKRPLGIDVMCHTRGKQHIKRLFDVNQQAIKNTIELVQNCNTVEDLQYYFKLYNIRAERFKFLDNYKID